MWEYIKRNTALSIATVTVITITFILINVFVTAQILIDKAATYLNQQQKISILYSPEAKEEEIMDLKGKLEEFDCVDKVVYKDSKTLQRENLKSLGFTDDEIKTFLDNQEEYIKILQIALKPDQDISQLLNFIKQEKDKGSQIMNVLYFEDLLNKIKTISRGLKISGTVVTALLLFISVQLIYFTISFTVLKQKDEIKTMYLVGAPKQKITTPFALQGGFYASISALVSMIFLVLILVTVKYTLGHNMFIQAIKDLLTTTGARSLLTLNNLIIITSLETIAGFLLGFLFAKFAANNTIKKFNYD